MPNNATPVAFNQDPSIQYIPPQTQNINQYNSGDQSKKNLIIPQNDILNKVLEKQNELARQLEQRRMEDKMEALKKENEQLKHQQIMDKI